MTGTATSGAQDITSGLVEPPSLWQKQVITKSTHPSGCRLRQPSGYSAVVGLLFCTWESSRNFLRGAIIMLLKAPQCRWCSKRPVPSLPAPAAKSMVWFSCSKSQTDMEPLGGTDWRVKAGQSPSDLPCLPVPSSPRPLCV